MRLPLHYYMWILIGLCTFCTNGPVVAQNCTESTATTYIQANRLRAAIRNGGDFFTDGQSAQFLTPDNNGSQPTHAAIYAAGLWLGGYDAGGNLHMAAQTYRQAGNDYWAGPIDSISGTADSLSCARFDQVWAVHILDILTLVEDYETNGVVDGPVPQTLLSWPGKGNPHYPALFGFALPNQQLAPFYDRNNDGIYDPIDGDYPVFEHNNPNAIADELLWTVFNDQASTHQVTDTFSMGVEVQLTAYAFNCEGRPAALKDVIFTKHRIINRSGNDYNGFRAGLHVDFDLGCGQDDYVGTDPALNTIYVYNADNDDNSTACPTGNTYGLNPPVASMTILNHPLQKSIFNLASTVSPFGHPRDPQPAVDYYNLLEGKWVDGEPLTYGNDGRDTSSSNFADFVFPNYPTDTAANKWWAGDALAWAQGQEFRMVGSLFGDTLFAGEERVIDAAFAYHDDQALTGLYNKLALIPQRVPQIQQEYDQGFSAPSCYSLTDFDAEIVGQVYWDANNSCSLNGSEEVLPNVILKATRMDTDQSYYATSDSNGFYKFQPLPFGEYEVIAITPSPYFQDQCVPGGIHSTILAHPNHVDSIDFALSEVIPCAYLEVDISTPVLRHCAANTYTVTYCNRGTDTAYNARVEVDIDNQLQVDSADLAYTYLGSNTYEFLIGTVPPNSCQSFDIHTFLSCDSSIVGQTHCAEAHIYPDTLCVNLWNGPIYQIIGQCMGDSIQFLISNVGTIPLVATQVELIVIEDNLMRPIDTVAIWNTPVAVSVPLDTGSTYRAMVNNPAGIPPVVSDPIVTHVLEGCGVDSLSQIQLGHVLEFSNGHSSPFLSIDCQESIDSSGTKSVLFFERRAFPKGYSRRNFIFDDTPLEYHIRVPNANLSSLKIRDTLSSYLDVASFEPGASSHRFNWRMYNEGIIEFTFDTTGVENWEEQSVFVKYRIAQNPMNPSGTIIRNRTEVELNPKLIIRDSDVFHEVAIDFSFVQLLQNVSTTFAQETGLRLHVFPNPMRQQAQITLGEQGAQFNELRVQLFDALGRQVLELSGPAAQPLLLNRGQLNAGIYYYRASADGQLLESGAVSVQ